ncbi:MAG: PhoX family phosphatase, partial [Acidobacteriota bacterium]|nr:PhoX family phosphatase [Acidobacteriota bacterium]
MKAPRSQGETFQDVMTRRLARREFLKGAVASASLLASGVEFSAAAQTPSLTFTPIKLTTEDRLIVPPGYTSQTLIRWGDPILPGAPAFNPLAQTAAAQAGQFGYNNDFLAFFPFSREPFQFAARDTAGLLAVNHETASGTLMFPNFSNNTLTREQVDIMIAAHGVSVVEIEYLPKTTWYAPRGWRYKNISSYNRRITGETEIELTGPAAGHPMLQTTADPTGRRVRGTLNNCAGGKTPWGTMLTGEENTNNYFGNMGRLATTDPRRAMLTRYGFATGASSNRWENFYDRFDVSKEPNEPFRFGYVVEIDPFDPYSTPKKRTALGRVKHEGATTALAKDGRVAVYTGDDERFEYIYKFVTKGTFNPNEHRANLNLLDEGTLYVAKFNDDGTGVWIPLVAGQGALAAWSQAEISFFTRGAADLVGATKMDRPEDIETNPANGKVYAVLTNNTRRGTTGNPGTDKANPRVGNPNGHIIELTEKGGDAAATTFNWEIFLLCGDPSVADQGTY